MRRLTRNNAWDIPRRGYYDDGVPGQAIHNILFGSFDETTHRVISNITEHVPILLFMPNDYVNSPQRSEVENIFIGKISALNFTNRFYQSHFTTSLVYTSFSHFSETIVTDDEYYTVTTSFLFGVYNHTVNMHSQTQGITHLHSPLAMVWCCVVPKEYSAQFHYDFITCEEIHPEKYGLEFWYNPHLIDTMRVSHKVYKALRTALTQLKVIAVAKSPDEMDSLFTDNIPSLRFESIEEEAEFNKMMIKEILTH